jgi:REP element-mobilizing transposase RayT
MPRQARLDAPDTLHHVMVRGIERTTIFRDDPDRTEFLGRLAALAEQGALTIYAWALLPTHVHLLVRTGRQPLSRSMRCLLTGYAGAFNRRHKRVGHLFQNRYKSIVVEEEAYLLELVRYLHLNPVRAKVLPDPRTLERSPWTGHSALVGKVSRPWQDTATILAQFGPTLARATRAYRTFVAAGLPVGHRPEFGGGGLLRSAGGWAAVQALRRQGDPTVADPRILGGGDFVERLLAEAEARTRATLRVSRPTPALAELAQRVAAHTGIAVAELRAACLNIRSYVQQRIIPFGPAHPCRPAGAPACLSAGRPAPRVLRGNRGTIPRRDHLGREPRGVDRAAPRSDGVGVSCLGTNVPYYVVRQ